MTRDTKVFLGIYLVVMLWIVFYNLTHPIVNDGVYEYRGYLLNIKEGWAYRYSSINSVLVSIWFPSVVQRVTQWDPWVIFRVSPAILYALMPAFIYLISRRYLDIGLSLVASLVVASSSYLLFFPDVGRNGVVLGLLSGMVWGLLGKRTLVSAVFAGLVVFAHYGTTIIALGLVVSTLAIILIWRIAFRTVTPIKPYLVTLVVLVVLTGAWHFGFARYSGYSMWSTLTRPDEARGILRSYGVETPELDPLKLESRDYVTQEAFGLNFLSNPTPLKVEIVTNWVVVLLITLGLFVVLHTKTVDNPFKFMLVSMYTLILVTIAVPHFSIFYGTQRVYFTSMVVLATCFSFGVRFISSRLKTKTLVVSSAVLGLYAVSTSGLIYFPFGITKILPVVLTLP